MSRRDHEPKNRKQNQDDSETIDISLPSLTGKQIAVLIVSFLFVGSSAAFVASGSGGSVSNGQTGQSSGSIQPIGEAFPIQGRGHEPEGTELQYTTNPPTSGPHWQRPASTGFYDNPLPDEQLVHNLEHGQIWIAYNDVSDETRDAIRSFTVKYPSAVIATPRAENDDSIVLVSWGRMLKLSSWDEATAMTFLRSNINNAPEPLAGAGGHQ